MLILSEFSSLNYSFKRNIFSTVDFCKFFIIECKFLCHMFSRCFHDVALLPSESKGLNKSIDIVEFYLYPTVGTVLIHSIKPELTE